MGMSTVLLLMGFLLDSVAALDLFGVVVSVVSPAGRSDGRAAPLVGSVPGPAVAARHRAHDRRAQLPGEAVVGGHVDPLPEAVHAARRPRWRSSVPGGHVALR